MARREGLSSALAHVTLDLSGGFNETACVGYALQAGFKCKNILKIFNKRALYRALPDLLGDPALTVNDDNLEEIMLRARRALYHDVVGTAPTEEGAQPMSKAVLGLRLLEEMVENGIAWRQADRTFRRKYLSNTLNHASTHRRDLFEAACGTGASRKIILCDECTEPNLIPVVQRLFGQAWNVDMINVRGEKDPEVVRAALDGEVDAIFSKDKQDKKLTDLMCVVMDAWTNPDIDPGRKRLHLVLLPHQTKKAIQTLRNQHKAVTKYLLNPRPDKVLSLVSGKPRLIEPSVGIRKKRWVTPERIPRIAQATRARLLQAPSSFAPLQVA